MMPLIIVGMSPDKNEVRLSGPNLSDILHGYASTFLLVTLGFRKHVDGSLLLVDETTLLPKFVSIIRFLKREGIPFTLTDQARNGIREWHDYLNQYTNALDNGAMIKEETGISIALPPEFKRTLKSYQEPSVRHIAHIPYSANFSVPGSGKTTVVLAAFSALKQTNDLEKIFVVGPRSAFDPWKEEFEFCFGRKPQLARLTGTPFERAEIFEEAERYELFLSTYQMAANEYERISSLLRRFKFLLVVDESHHLKKGEGGVWFDAVFGFASLAQRRIILTGTPAPNALVDIRPQFEILWPGVRAFTSHLLPWDDGDKSIEKLRELIQPLYVRIRKNELGLPKKIVQRVTIPMDSIQSRIYGALTRSVLSEVVKDPSSRYFIRDLRRGLVMRLIQAASNPTLLGEFSSEFGTPPLPHLDVAIDSLIMQYSKYEFPRKLRKALDIARSLVEKKQKMIMWTSFVHNADVISRELEKEAIGNVVITGSVPKDETEDESHNRDLLIRRFKEDPEVKALVATTFSVGEAVSLHRTCQRAIYLDRTFNCGIYMQSMDRIHRIGLTSDQEVVYYLLITEDTIDEVIDNRLEEKMKTMYALLDDDIGILDLDIPDIPSLNGLDSEDVKAVSNHLFNVMSRDESEGI